MQSQRFSLGIAGVLAACVFSLSAHANSAGKTGRSGKQGPTCMEASCHSTSPSAAIPTVTLEGPSSLTAGTTGNYTLVITGGAGVKAGMNVAVSDNGGTLDKVGTELRAAAGELTHTSPKPFVANEVRFDFTLLAPTTNRTVTLYASGNSVNGNANLDGDHSASTTKDVQVTGATSAPDAGTPDAGTGNPDDGNTDKGGCSAVGGAPLALLLAVVAERLRRRAS
jgi:hypothetical protein